MGETLREAIASIAMTFTRTFDFNGRSRRLDVGYYWIASMLVAGVLRPATTIGLDWASAVIAREAIDLAVAIPFLALFARRLHDQGRSTWWLLLAPPLIVANIYDVVRVNFHAFDPAWPELGMWNLGRFIVALLVLALIILPGETDANRYGPDPRLTEPHKDPA